jgi:hypothetical protein
MMTNEEQEDDTKKAKTAVVRAEPEEVKATANLGNGYRFKGGFLNRFGKNPTERVITSGVRKRCRTEESSVETLDNKRIPLEVTDPSSKDQVAAQPSCLKAA